MSVDIVNVKRISQCPSCGRKRRRASQRVDLITALRWSYECQFCGYSWADITPLAAFAEGKENTT